ncbi:MAG: hypothetical protein KKG75_03395 [Nanoarchaeota archaeon]|nr:hypothetical protein [Nanoarchaeota archaeon]
MFEKDSLSVKIGKTIIGTVGTSLIIIEVYERFKKSFNIDSHIFALSILCITLILLIVELVEKNKEYLNIWRF